ncbi:copper chaperone CopZ [Salipaludibacillus sp. HK11]|uniref:copper chaperone CopZ n=1 Tax=Salipaludibacillus sp. HK11 TaxID=3394320 RepID=UPI0039FDC6CC
MKKETIQVDGMTCGHCKASVEGALNNVKGVSKAEVNLDAKNVAVEFNDGEVTIAKLKEEIEEQGYDVQ